MIERTWKVTISWGSDGRDLDIYSAVNAGGQTSSGVGWHNGQETSKIVVNDGQVNGTFYAIWGGDDTSAGGSETVTVYFRGSAFPTGAVEVATLTTHLNFYGEGSSPVTITVSNQAGSYEGAANTRYSNRANTGDPFITVPILADGGSATSMYLIELSSMPQGNGMASGGGLFASGASCSANATPKSGATFLGWYEGGTLVSSDNPYTFTAGSDRSLVAHFSCHVEVDSETVPQPASGGGGTVSGGGDLAPGSSCTITATPYSGYDFINWTNNRDSTTITTPTHTFTVDGDVTWTAHFERKHVWVIVKCDQEGALRGSGGHSGGPCAYHEVVTSYRDGTGVHYGYIGVNHNRPPGSFASAHKYAVDDTVRIGLHGTNLEVPYGEYNPQPKQWRFDRWDPSISGFNPVYTYSDGSCGFVLTQAIIDEYAVLASTVSDQHDVYGIPDSDRVIILTAYLQPTRLSTVTLEIAEGGSHGAIRNIGWATRIGDATTQFVTIVANTANKYEARVPETYRPTSDKKVDWVYSLFPDVNQGFHVYKYEVTTPDWSDVYEGYFNDDSFSVCYDLYELVAWSYGDGNTLPSRVSVKFYIRTNHIGKLLCTGAGKMLCNSSGQLMYAG